MLGYPISHRAPGKRLLEHLLIPLPQGSSLRSSIVFRLVRLKSLVGRASEETYRRKETIIVAYLDCIEADFYLTF